MSQTGDRPKLWLSHMNDLYSLLREEALQLSSEFRKASIQGRGTSQEIAEFRENAVQAFVGRYFPFPHRVAKGKVRDSLGNIAASIDCVICAPNHPYTVSVSGKFNLLLAEGVDSVVEVKPNIADRAELYRALEQGLSVKKLRRATTPMIRPYGILGERAKRVPFGIFAMQCKAAPIETGFEILEFYESRRVEPIDQADFIVVHDVCVFSNFVDKTLNPWEVSGYPNQQGWFYEGWGHDSLVGFLLRLHTVAHSSLKMQEDVLPRYLTPPQEARFRIVDMAFKYDLYKKSKNLPTQGSSEVQRMLRAITHPDA